MEETLYQITSAESIGDTLIPINNNYNVLDTLLFNIQTSALNYWIPMSEIYENRKTSWKKATDAIKDNYDSWQSIASTFEYNSARWITPIVTWFQCFFNYDQVAVSPDLAEKQIFEWVNLNYPIITDGKNPNYTELQTLIVYALSYDRDKSIIQNYNLSDKTTCSTLDQKVCVYCTKCYHGGGVNCNNGGFTCGGCSRCSKCEEVECFYKNNKKTMESRIGATLKVTYENKYEAEEMIAYIYKVENCKWVFDGIVGSYYAS
jgi:hypothetical protein